MSEKSKNILLGVLIVGLVSMTVAYAALSTNLAINGTANVAATRWDIHFTGIQDKTSTLSNTLGSATNDAAVTSLGTLDSNGGTLIDGLTITLAKPGDIAEVDFNIVNTGTIDAKLNTFSKTIALGEGSPVSTDVNDVVTYTIKCGSPEADPAQDDELVKTSGSVACKLKVQYNELTSANGAAQTSQTAGQNQTVNIGPKTFHLTANWNYVQK